MLALSLGIAAFALYFIYDANSFLWQRRLPRIFFVIGTLLLAVSFSIELRAAWAMQGFKAIWDGLLLGMCALSFAALIYTLFFALPFDETYAKQENGRCVCDIGVYAMCRHPGILFFFGMYLFAGLAALPSAGLLIRGMILSAINLAYAWFQDRITFPRSFTDYHEYQQKVPFLLPTKSSLTRARKTLIRSGSEEVES